MSSFFSWDLVWEFFPKILSALPVTLLIVGIATFVGLVLGSFIAFIRVEKIPILNQIAAVFVSFIRFPLSFQGRSDFNAQNIFLIQI